MRRKYKPQKKTYYYVVKVDDLEESEINDIKSDLVKWAHGYFVGDDMRFEKQIMPEITIEIADDDDNVEETNLLDLELLIKSYMKPDCEYTAQHIKNVCDVEFDDLELCEVYGSLHNMIDSGFAKRRINLIGINKYSIWK